ncbi:reverse transcriptase [Gossypium australe]|uniref:Reverse transcriptase n=1 Tax=Gossypium australe TaxID=47621 RepID=A0A5B6W338_9ROSI|nr:reverse transcriptase [Gossypium australe]
MVGRRKKEAFQNLKDRFKQRIDNWSTRHLSQGGKEVFIKAILQAILMYTMACFLLPKTLCADLESIIAKFRWQKGHGQRGIHWCTWNDLCIAKEQGGLGFRSLDQFNIALLAKQGLKSKIFSKFRFHPCVVSVWTVKGLLQDGLCWHIGKGDRISVWNDCWIPGVDINRSNDNANNTEIELVSDLIETTTRKWKNDLIQNTFPENTAQKILQIPLAEEEHEDFQVWRGEHSGEFTVRSAYKLLQEATMDPSALLIQTETKDFYRKL